LDAGAIAVALSGAGPTVIAFSSPEYKSASAEGIGQSMEKAFLEAGVVSRSVLLNPTPRGAVVSLERR
jgi:homoserine kinase